MLIEEKRQDIYIVFVSFLQIKLNTCPLRAEYHHIGDKFIQIETTSTSCLSILFDRQAFMCSFSINKMCSFRARKDLYDVANMSIRPLL